MENKSSEDLRALAAYLDARRNFILLHWRAATEELRGGTVAPFLTRLQFNDHIPAVLDALTAALCGALDGGTQDGAQSSASDVVEHGHQRWQQGYRLRELTGEWGQLQFCLMDELELFAQQHPNLDPETMLAARRQVAQVCWDGVVGSANEFWRLHQAAAACQVRDLRRALATLEQVERARAQHWREAAHDLRGSVTVVELAAHVIKSDEGVKEIRDLGLDSLGRGVASLHTMLTELMSLARLEAGEEERQVGSFDAGALLASFCAAMRPVAEQHGLWLKTEGPDSLQVDGDERKVERILNNLLRSAINHTRRGGVTVLWGPVESGPERDCWSFCVEDTGAGLGGEPLASLAAELCHATGRAHEAVKSQGEPVDAAPTEKSESQPLPPDEVADEGVGLAIVKRLCELLDATLELETGPGRGSTYRVTFPMEY